MVKITNITQQQIDAINIISQFLSPQDNYPKNTDLFILLGSALVDHLDFVANSILTGQANKLMIVGGIGHSTKFLVENVNSHSIYSKYLRPNMTEAQLYTLILEHEFKVPSNKIILENKSTNCGDNAYMSFQLLKSINYTPKSALLIQDPTMQLRSYASFSKEWMTIPTKLYSFAPFKPELALNEHQLPYFKNISNAPWSLIRFIDLVLGEIPRLRDDYNGYGPSGKNFIIHVDLPKKVLASYTYLVESFSSIDLFKRRKENMLSSNTFTLSEN